MVEKIDSVIVFRMGIIIMEQSRIEHFAVDENNNNDIEYVIWVSQISQFTY